MSCLVFQKDGERLIQDFAQPYGSPLSRFFSVSDVEAEGFSGEAGPSIFCQNPTGKGGKDEQQKQKKTWYFGD